MWNKFRWICRKFNRSFLLVCYLTIVGQSLMLFEWPLLHTPVMIIFYWIWIHHLRATYILRSHKSFYYISSKKWNQMQTFLSSWYDCPNFIYWGFMANLDIWLNLDSILHFLLLTCFLLPLPKLSIITLWDNYNFIGVWT